MPAPSPFGGDSHPFGEQASQPTSQPATPIPGPPPQIAASPTALLTSTGTATYSKRWALDSGATNFMSGNPSLFSSLESNSNLPPVTLANGSQAPVGGVG